MAYSLQILPAVRGGLFNYQGLSRADRIKLFSALDYLRDHGDDYRINPDLRLSPDSEHFFYSVILRLESGKLRNFQFVVSDAAAIYGVLRVVYFDDS